MKKDYTFLAEDGKLTMSSAAHLRDLAANASKELLQKLNNIHFTNKYIQLIGDTNRNQTRVGLNAQECTQIPNAIQHVINLQSFEAWMNEAIEAKRRLFKEIENLSLQEYVENILGEEYPISPRPSKSMTEDDYLSTLTIKERNKYFYLQTTVAAIGKLIHKDSPYDKAFKELYDSTINPVKEVLNGRDTILHISEPSVSSEVANEVFYGLQNTHREAQAQLNGMKDLMDKTIKRDVIERTELFRKQYEEYQMKIQNYSILLTKYKQSATSELEKLKIVIPNHLEDTYKQIISLGK